MATTPLASAEFRVQGLDCVEEVALIRNRLDGEAGVSKLTFDVFNGKMDVEFDEHETSADQISAAVGKTGLGCELWAEDAQQESSWDLHGRSILAGVSGGALLFGLLVQGLAGGSFWIAILAHEHFPTPPSAIAAFVLAILSGSYFFVPKALGSLRILRPDMNALVLISIIGACVLGEWAEGATLAFLFAIAGRLENWSMSRARNAVRSLIEVAPQEASVVHGDHEHRMAADRVEPGATVRVRPGEHVPCDGKVTGGSSGVNEAMLTGEPVPIWKSAGDEVFAGTLNGDGVLEIETTKAASDSRLARIVRMIQESQHHRAASEQFVDRFARYYTPAMFGVAALTIVIPPLFLAGEWSHWFYQGMLILLISCPCALVISTPVTIVAAVAAAARRGVLIKGGAYLEEAARLRVLAFDKTGVLTEGEPKVERIRALAGRSVEETLERLASLEHYSEHPLARAIVSYAAEQGVSPRPVERFLSLQGKGAEADFGGESFWVGNSRMMSERVTESDELREALAESKGSARTVVVCGQGSEAWALVELSDPIRPEAREMVSAVRALGVERLVMLTGDNSLTAHAVAEAVGLENVRAELLPEDKTAEVERLLETYGRVGMVGDGVNDAQAIATASVGIGVGAQGTDIALETAHVVLMSSRLENLPFLIRHARRASRVIKENVAIALVFKAVFLALALMGIATLWMAVAADMGATLIVIFNGLRLLRAREPEARPPDLAAAAQAA